MSRLRVEHTTEFTYGGPGDGVVQRGAHDAAVPGPARRPSASLMTLDPHTWRHDYRDYWGTARDDLRVLPHQSLLSSGRRAWSSVTPVAGPYESRGGHPATASSRTTWRSSSRRLAPRPGPGRSSRRSPTGAPPTRPREAAQRLCVLVRDAVEVRPGATAVHAAARGVGRAQGRVPGHGPADRRRPAQLGIPARYVSGYLATPAQRRARRVFDRRVPRLGRGGSGSGSRSTRRTGRPVGQNHVVLARGRDYQDVPPLKGVYSGQGVATLDVAVRFTRLA